MKYRLLFFIFGLISFHGFSQANSSDWKVIFENDQVKFSSQKIKCEIPEEAYFVESVLIHIQNKTSDDIEITWFNDLFYNNECVTCSHSNPEFKNTISLKSGASISGECGMGAGLGLRIFSKWTRMANTQELSFFDITGVTVKSLTK